MGWIGWDLISAVSDEAVTSGLWSFNKDELDTLTRTKFRRLDSNQDNPTPKVGALPITLRRTAATFCNEIPPRTCFQDTGRDRAAVSTDSLGPSGSPVVIRFPGRFRRHAPGGPAFDPAIEVCTAIDVDAKAAVIVLLHVLPHCLRVVMLQRGPEELIERRAGNFRPEALSRFHIGVLNGRDPASFRTLSGSERPRLSRGSVGPPGEFGFIITWLMRSK